jgi:hypothetical protein
MAYNFPIDYVDEPLAKWRITSLAIKPYKRTLIPRVVEVKAAVENLLEKYPDIRNRYSPQLEAFYRRADYSSAVTAWEFGNSTEARKYLSRHLTHKKFAFVYLCTLVLSHRFFYRLRLGFRNLTTSIR